MPQARGWLNAVSVRESREAGVGATILRNWPITRTHIGTTLDGQFRTIVDPTPGAVIGKDRTPEPIMDNAVLNLLSPMLAQVSPKVYNA